jgi:hypothetical protein
MKVGSSIDSTSERTSNVRINATKRFIPRNFQATCGILLGIAIWATAAGGRVDQGQGIQELLSNSREKKNVLKLIDEKELVDLAIAMGGITAPSGYEQPMADFVLQWLKENGFEKSYQRQVAEKRANTTAWKFCSRGIPTADKA